MIQDCCFAPALSTVKGAEQRNDNRQRDQDDVTVGYMVRRDVRCQTKIISSNSIRYVVFYFCAVTKEQTGENHSGDVGQHVVSRQHDVIGQPACRENRT